MPATPLLTEILPKTIAWCQRRTARCSDLELAVLHARLVPYWRALDAAILAEDAGGAMVRAQRLMECVKRRVA